MFFGTDEPKFIFNPLTTNEEVLLDNVVITKDDFIEDKIIHESIFTGHRFFILRGKYKLIEMKLHLYKYESPLDFYEIVKGYESQLVRFFMHRSGDYYKDVSGNEVSFFINKIDESYYRTTDYKDLLLIRFVSQKYVEMTAGII